VARPRGLGRVFSGAPGGAGADSAVATGGVAPGAAASAGPVARMRAFAAVWGGWLLVTGLVFSYMQGIIHPYYMVALAPAIGALVGVGATALWQARVGWTGRATAAAGVAVTAWWSYELLDRTPAWLPWLRWVVLLAGAVAVVALAATAVLARGQRPPGWRVTAAAVVATGGALVAGLAGPLAYTLDTVNSTSTGAIPSAGPTVTGAFGGGGPGGGRFGGFPGGTGAGTGTGTGTGTGGAGGTGGGFGGGFPGGNVPGGGTGTGNGTGNGTGAGTGGSGGGTAAGNGTGTAPGSGFGRRGAGGGTRGTGGTGGFGGGTRGAGGFGGAGGLSGSTTVSSALVKLLEQDSSKYRWIAATEGTQEAAPIELATGGLAVVAIGGFNGSDPSPTLAQFESMVAKHEVHYYVGQGSNSFGGGSVSSSIASWVSAHYKAETVGGTTVYDLTKPAS
jgi:hypothetical protein